MGKTLKDINTFFEPSGHKCFSFLGINVIQGRRGIYCELTHIGIN